MSAHARRRPCWRRFGTRQFAYVRDSAIVDIDRIQATHPWLKGHHMVVPSTGQEPRMSRYWRETFQGLTRFRARTP